jgi:hypothetical protein
MSGTSGSRSQDKEKEKEKDIYVCQQDQEDQTTNLTTTGQQVSQQADHC